MSNMNAKQAREMATSIANEKSRSQYDDIKQSIKSAVEDEKFSVHIFETIRPSVRTKLEQEGFKVGIPESHRNETTVEIFW